ncbi:MAG TPA: Gfo/Idh/MocA family oxidoreductase [Candidatus Brocadiia bacterium]|nr:Gfo/Idh/MocA family oxidoreductase [Candidatus Brocadiia bacterium]
MKMRAAVVGLGIGKAHAAVYAERADVELVGLVDTVPERLRQAAEATPAPTFGDLDAMLAAAKPDIVSIATPPHLHYPQAKACIEAGAHVLVEKPLAATAIECETLARLGEEGGRVLMVAQKKRFIEPNRFLKEKVSGEWGPVKAASALYWLGRVELDWFWDDGQGGGPLVENSVHMIDILRHLIGDVETVYAAGGNLFMEHRRPVPDLACATLKFRSGAVASLALGYGSEWNFASESLYLATDKATAHMTGPFDRPNLLRWSMRGSGRTESREFNPNGFPEEIDAFLKAVRGESANPVPASDAAKSIAVCLAIKDSLKTGKPVEMG